MYDHANPPGYHNVTPSITVRGAADAIEFYQQVFGAAVRRRMEMPDGKIMHSELTFGDSAVMVNDENPDWCVFGPQSIGGSAVTLQLYVQDVDVVFAAAVAAGAESLMPPADQFWGDRMGKLKDPFGHLWTIATRVEEVSDAEIDERGHAFLEKMAE